MNSVYDLLGEDVVVEYGYVPERSVAFVPLVQIGDGLAGPPNDQPLQIFRDTRPLAVDELGMGHLGKVARHRAGRAFPLNDSFDSGLDHTLPGRAPEQDMLRSRSFGPAQDPGLHAGVLAPEVVTNPRTVYWTATPDAGWDGW